MKKRALFLLGLLCLCLYISNKVTAQEITAGQPAGIGRVSGTVVDSLTGKPIEYVTVALLQGQTDASVDGTLTDGQGRFSFRQVPAGTYRLALSFIGYEKKMTAAVSVSAGKPEVSLGTLPLSTSATALKEVTVQSLRPTITQEADKMVVSIEGTALAAGRTAFDVLAAAPGVFVDHEGNIQLNGKAGVTVMLDGKLTYLSGRDLRNMLESMPAENLKNLEIITNPSAKFDAEGSSGILNINLKKNTLQGMNGSVYAGATHNLQQLGYTTGANLNLKKGPWNSFLNLDMARRVGGREATFTRVFYATEKTTYFDQTATGNYLVQGPPSIRLGTDYSFNSSHSLGGMVYFNSNYLESDFLTETFLGTSPNRPVDFIDADNFNENQFTNLTTNLRYFGKLDTLGTTLSADLDFVKITNDGEGFFYNYYSKVSEPGAVVNDFLYTSTPSGYDIYAAKVDFTKPFSKDSKFETGVKASRVSSDNDSRFYFDNGPALVLDPKRTNYFLYDEDIYAAYVNWSGKLGAKTTLQTGLRAEQTISVGESLTTKQRTRRSYLNFFPSVFLQQKISDNYQLNFSYSRRLQRPNYGSLNPFISLRDPNTLVTGNPNLRPQYTQSFGLTQTIKKTYSLALNYNYTTDVISELPIIDVDNALTIYTTGNVDNSHNVSLTALAPYRVMKNWESNNTLLLSYSEFNAVANGIKIDNDQLFYMLQSNHTMLIPWGLKAEMNLNYRGPAASGLYWIAPYGWVNAGLKKSFLNDKLDVTVNANDIFKTQRLMFTTPFGENINEFDQYFRSRSFGLTLRYKFSKGQKFEQRKLNSLDEVNRT